MRIVIDGSRFSDIGGFYDEMEHILTKDLSWRTGRNMDAFHDLLRGGFGVFEYGESVDFFWIHSEKRVRLRCHGTLLGGPSHALSSREPSGSAGEGRERKEALRSYPV